MTILKSIFNYLILKKLFLLAITFFTSSIVLAQDKVSLEYFIITAKENAPVLRENDNLLKIGTLQNNIITAQNNAFQINATSEVLIAPYFNNNGKIIDITTTPSANAIGYDVGITNGGLYSAQINVTKNLFNQAITDNLLFQNKISNNTYAQKHFSAQKIKNIEVLKAKTLQS